jgi:hypothetical protein
MAIAGTDERRGAAPTCGGAATSPARTVGAFREWLATVDVAELPDRERVELIGELERLKGAAGAAQAGTTDALCASSSHARPQDAVRSVGSEVALARRCSPFLGDRYVRLAHALVHDLPHTMASLARGDIGELQALAVHAETAVLTPDDRAEVDERIAPALARLGPRAAGRAARRVAAEIDASAVDQRLKEAVAARKVSLRPAPDGMAYLTVLAPMRDVVGAHDALKARARTVVGGQDPEEDADGRGTAAVMADTATRLLAGLERGQVQPVEVHLVITDKALLGTGDPEASVMESARVPGHGPVPAPAARRWVREAPDGAVWLRRLYTGPDGRDLVAMDARRRYFSGLLRRMLVLRDDTCATPWCDAPIVHADHTEPAHSGGISTFLNGSGTCARCNLVKEAPGWRHTVIGESPRRLSIRTPSGRVYEALAPPLLGWGAAERPAMSSRSP